ncbi:MAG: response regulator transcription factor [Saprospiraceae bacterium]
MEIRNNNKHSHPMNNTLHLKVFITDDHPIVVEGLKAFLAKTSGFNVVGTATSAQQMFEFLPEAKPHLLLLDLNLPGTDFYANIKWVKDHAPWVKIVVFSEYHSADLVRSLFHEGIAGFVAKTARPSEITEALRQIHDGEAVVVEPVQQMPAKAANEELFCDGFKKRLSLSRREQEILALISRGLSSQRIGKTLFISKHTVETHRKNILRKLDFNTSTELVKFAVQHGLV